MWVREMWMRWLFVCILFEFASFLVPPPLCSFKTTFRFVYLFFLLQYCLPNQAYLFISVTKRTLLIICSTQELIDCFLPWNCPSHWIWIFSHVRIANHIFVEKATLVRFVRCLVERFVKFGTERRLSHNNNKSGDCNNKVHHAHASIPFFLTLVYYIIYSFVCVLYLLKLQYTI